MDYEKLKNTLPTLFDFLEKRKAAAKNRLPKHLRPLPRWPIFLQIALNLGIIILLATLMINRDDYLTEAGPAVGLVVSLLFLIYTLISALQLRHRYQKSPGYRWVQINFCLMIIAAIMFPIGVATFLP